MAKKRSRELEARLARIAASPERQEARERTLAELERGVDDVAPIQPSAPRELFDHPIQEWIEISFEEARARARLQLEEDASREQLITWCATLLRSMTDARQRDLDIAKLRDLYEDLCPAFGVDLSIEEQARRETIAIATASDTVQRRLGDHRWAKIIPQGSPRLERVRRTGALRTSNYNFRGLMQTVEQLWILAAAEMRWPRLAESPLLLDDKLVDGLTVTDAGPDYDAIAEARARARGEAWPPRDRIGAAKSARDLHERAQKRRIALESYR